VGHKKNGYEGKEKGNRLKWEVAEELNLADDLSKGGDELSVREAGKIGGNVVKKYFPKSGSAYPGSESPVVSWLQSPPE